MLLNFIKFEFLISVTMEFLLKNILHQNLINFLFIAIIISY